MDVTIVLAMLGGVLIGMAAFTIAVTAGLSMKEIYFLSEFWKSLKSGEYEWESDEDDDDESR